jgi:hypothetical protein
MPVNKLWLEHTEKAAWDSVQALRGKIADAERRIERLRPPVAAWRPLLDELDRARGELGLHDEDYVDVLRLVLERAAHDRKQIEELGRERKRHAQPHEQPVDVTALIQRPVRDPFDDDDDYLSLPRRVAEVRYDLERRRRELLADGPLPDDVEALLNLIDAKVADLGDIEGQALSDAALDLGVFALALATLRDDGDET